MARSTPSVWSSATCRTLRLEVDGLPIGGWSVTARTKTSWIQAIDQGVNTSALDARVKRFFVRSFEELKFSLENMVVFGFESAWAESANLVGAVLRFRNELELSADLRGTWRQPLGK